MPQRLLLASLVLLTSIAQAQPSPFSCTDSTHPQETFSDKSYRFLLDLTALSPTAATQLGYHAHHGVSLDTQLDDFSPSASAHQRALLLGGQACFAAAASEDPEDQADLALLRDAIASQLFSLDRHTERNHPQDYVETIGSAIFFPLTQTSGTAATRLSGVIARMGQIPRALAQARANLTDADPVFIDTAIEENDGNKDVITLVGTLVRDLPKADADTLLPRYDAAAKPALAALTDFSTFLRTDLAARPHVSTWRTGPAYARIFRFALGPGTTETPQTLLASAEAAQTDIRHRMFALARPLHDQWFPTQPYADLSGDALENTIIAEVLNRIDDDHTTAGKLLDTIKAQAASIRAFIIAKNFIALDDPEVNIVPTPEFLRSSYSVAGAYPAPPLDPDTHSQYWVTPIDPKAPAAETVSKLREYNNWMLQWLTMHEALPGHYTQFGHANRIQPVSRRIVRAVLSSGPYQEGWGEYGVQEMLDEGYAATPTAANDPRFLLMVLKIRLRAATNAVLDIRMQSMGMTDEQAMDMMEHKAFQSHAEALGKLRRTKLTSGQLITYFVGFRQWTELRAHAEQATGPHFDLKRFNDTALDEGALPMPLLEPLVLRKLTR